VSGVALLGTNGGELMTIKGSSLNKNGGVGNGRYATHRGRDEQEFSSARPRQSLGSDEVAWPLGRLRNCPLSFPSRRVGTRGLSIGAKASRKAAGRIAGSVNGGALWLSL